MRYPSTCCVGWCERRYKWLLFNASFILKPGNVTSPLASLASVHRTTWFPSYIWFNKIGVQVALLLDRMIILFLVLWETSLLFSILVAVVHIFTNNVSVPFSSYPYQHFFLFVLVMIVISNGTCWNHNVDLIRISFYGHGCWPLGLCIYTLKNMKSRRVKEVFSGSSWQWP
jgi:hypothetical protein